MDAEEIKKRFDYERDQTNSHIRLLLERNQVHLTEIERVNAFIGQFDIKPLPVERSTSLVFALASFLDPNQMVSLANHLPETQKAVADLMTRVVAEKASKQPTGGTIDFNDRLTMDIANVILTLHNLQIIAASQTPTNHTNLLRQGFILLMTAFDATIFDLARLALQQNFFHFARHLGKDEQAREKTSLSDMAAAGSFDALRDKIIDEQLKRRYLKDIIRLFTDASIQLSDAPDQLKELVQRRNVHLHNRGIIDQKYLDHGNPDGLTLGEVAAIDHPYWDRALKLTTEAVTRLAEWIEKADGEG